MRVFAGSGYWWAHARQEGTKISDKEFGDRSTAGACRETHLELQVFVHLREDVQYLQHVKYDLDFLLIHPDPRVDVRLGSVPKVGHAWASVNILCDAKRCADKYERKRDSQEREGDI